MVDGKFSFELGGAKIIADEFDMKLIVNEFVTLRSN